MRRTRAARRRQGDLQGISVPTQKQLGSRNEAARKPNFLIAGAGKAGTTSLHDYLGQHPGILMSSFKEPNYFVPGYGYKDWDAYLSLFDGARNEKAIGESSTGYLYCEHSPAWIKSVLGDIKIILILRNPARRAASLYWWMVREGYEDAPTFTAALELEPSRIHDPRFAETCSEFHHSYHYYSSGLYSAQVRRFLETFGSKNVRIYVFEEFARNPLAICRDIFGFLDVDPAFEPKIAIHNRARLPASPRLQFWLRNRASKYLRMLPSQIRRRMVEGLINFNTRRGSAPIRDVTTETQLLEKYRDDINNLEQLIDRDLSVWLK
jgi:sulfotransferase family protein